MYLDWNDFIRLGRERNPGVAVNGSQDGGTRLA